MKTATIVVNGVELQAKYRKKNGMYMFGSVHLIEEGKPVGPDLQDFLSSLGVCAQGRFYPIWYGFETATKGGGTVSGDH